jgi:hypothetical protein
MEDKFSGKLSEQSFVTDTTHIIDVAEYEMLDTPVHLTIGECKCQHLLHGGECRIYQTHVKLNTASLVIYLLFFKRVFPLYRRK